MRMLDLGDFLPASLSYEMCKNIGTIRVHSSEHGPNAGLSRVCVHYSWSGQMYTIRSEWMGFDEADEMRCDIQDLVAEFLASEEKVVL